MAELILHVVSSDLAHTTFQCPVIPSTFWTNLFSILGVSGFVLLFIFLFFFCFLLFNALTLIIYHFLWQLMWACIQSSLLGIVRQQSINIWQKKKKSHTRIVQRSERAPSPASWRFRNQLSLSNSTCKSNEPGPEKLKIMHVWPAKTDQPLNLMSDMRLHFPYCTAKDL